MSATSNDMKPYLPGHEVEEALSRDDENKKKKGLWTDWWISTHINPAGAAEFELKKKSLLNQGDMAKYSLNRGLNMQTFNLTYQLPFVLNTKLPLFLRATPLTMFDRQKCNLFLAYQVDVRRTKHEFHERSWITELAFIDTPWRVKFE